MKDILKGKGGDLIEEAYFLWIKQYGYYYKYLDIVTESIKMKSKSVFAGVPRYCLTFNEIIKIFNVETIIKQTPNRFFKSLKSLEITIKSIKISIKKTKFIKNQIYTLQFITNIRSYIYDTTNKIINTKHFIIIDFLKKEIKFV